MTIKQANLIFKNPLTPLNLANIKFIVIHHTASATATPEQIHEWHLANGWAGAGYNEYIRKDGFVWILRGDNVGAHASGYNTNGYGICCEGNFDLETTMSNAQFTSLVERVKFHAARFPHAALVKHSDVGSTACPGKYFPWAQLTSGKGTSTVSETPHPEDLQCAEAVNPQPEMYRVRKTWQDAGSQIGAFRVLQNAVELADANAGHKVFNAVGTVVYDPAGTAGKPALTIGTQSPFQWKQDAFDYLQGIGVAISETRFDDNITRGELFVLLERFHRSTMKNGH